MRYRRGLAAVLIAAVQAAVAGCTAEQIRDFQAAFHTPAAAGNAEQCPPPLQAKAVAPPPLTAAQRTLTMGIWMYAEGDYGGSENYVKSALSLDTRTSTAARGGGPGTVSFAWDLD